MEVVEREVTGPLADAVQGLWFLRGPAPARFERIFPMTVGHLIVNLSPTPYRVLDRPDAAWRTLGAAFCSGLRSEFVVSEAPEVVVNAGAVVRTDGLRLLGLDPTALAAGITTQPWLAAPAALGVDAPAAAVLDAVESLLGARLDADRGVDQVVRAAIAALDANPSRPIGELAAGAGLRHPAFIARFRRATGTTPKQYAQLVRFGRLLDATPVPGVPSWSALAAEGGYFDQSHVIRAFRRFAGFTPAEFHRRVSVAGADAVRFVPDPESAFR